MPKVGITEEQLERLYQVIPEVNYERDVLLYRMLWNLGGRVSEILDIKVEDLNKQVSQGRMECWINVRVLKRKIPYEHRVFINEGLMLAIESYCQKKGITSGYIFSITRQEVYHICRRDGHQIGIPKLGPHKFRHGLGQYLMNTRRVSPNLVADRLGHSSPRMTVQFYGSVSDDARRSIVEDIEPPRKETNPGLMKENLERRWKN